MDTNQIIKPFSETLYKEGIEDLAIDFAELPIDNLTSMIFAECVLDLPIVKEAVALGKTAWSIKRAVSFRNQIAFIQHLKIGDVNPKSVEKRKKAIKNDEEWIRREIETSLIYLDRYTNAKKAVYQARMYGDLLNERITFDQYEEYITILDQLFISDIKHLVNAVKVYDENEDVFFYESGIDSLATQFDKVPCGRLQSLGLLEGIITTRVGSSRIERYVPTDRAYYMSGIVLQEKKEV